MKWRRCFAESSTNFTKMTQFWYLWETSAECLTSWELVFLSSSKTILWQTKSLVTVTSCTTWLHTVSTRVCWSEWSTSSTHCFKKRTSKANWMRLLISSETAPVLKVSRSDMVKGMRERTTVAVPCNLPHDSWTSAKNMSTRTGMVMLKLWQVMASNKGHPVLRTTRSKNYLCSTQSLWCRTSSSCWSVWS